MQQVQRFKFCLCLIYIILIYVTSFMVRWLGKVGKIFNWMSLFYTCDKIVSFQSNVLNFDYIHIYYHIYWIKNKTCFFFRTGLTMFTSAYWHGVYIGYYLCFGSVPFYVPMEDIYDKLYRQPATGKVRCIYFFLSVTSYLKKLHWSDKLK